jgi:hypothetical protein
MGEAQEGVAAMPDEQQFWVVVRATLWGRRTTSIELMSHMVLATSEDEAKHIAGRHFDSVAGIQKWTITRVYTKAEWDSLQKKPLGF